MTRRALAKWCKMDQAFLAVWAGGWWLGFCHPLSKSFQIEIERQRCFWGVQLLLAKASGPFCVTLRSKNIEGLNRYETSRILLIAIKEYWDNPEEWGLKVWVHSSRKSPCSPIMIATKIWLIAITLMTVHSSKALNSSKCFVVGMEEDRIFPSQGLMMQSRERFEKKRRLFYVATTRAMDKLYSHLRPLTRYRFGRLFWIVSRCRFLRK